MVWYRSLGLFFEEFWRDYKGLYFVGGYVTIRIGVGGLCVYKILEIDDRRDRLRGRDELGFFGSIS